MAEASIAHKESAGEGKQSTREQRGLSLYLNRGEEITYYPVSDEYGIPSATDSGVHYIVSLDDESCECEDATYGGHCCKHRIAATIYAAKVAAGKRGPGRAALPPRYGIESDHSLYGDEGLYHVVEIKGAERRRITTTASFDLAAKDVRDLRAANEAGAVLLARTADRGVA